LKFFRRLQTGQRVGRYSSIFKFTHADNMPRGV
jgi:hypothetical protein